MADIRLPRLQPPELPASMRGPTAAALLALVASYLVLTVATAVSAHWPDRSLEERDLRANTYLQQHRGV